MFEARTYCARRRARMDCLSRKIESAKWVRPKSKQMEYAQYARVARWP